MMQTNHLYPLKFQPILKDTIWGGNKIKEVLNKEDAGKSTGESWELSAVKGNISVVSNGFLAGNKLTEIIEIYMDELVGQKVFDRFGNDFPLLIKFIDAQADLSIQVHPDDALAKERHNAFGKTEMWYVLGASSGASLISGFKKTADKKTYLSHLQNGTIEELLNKEKVNPGDVFFIPAGRVHAIGSGILLAEIQQTSDITYRIYDYKRKDKDGNERELHTELALDAIDFEVSKEYKTPYKLIRNQSTPCVSSEYFTTNIISLDTFIEKDYNMLDSFVVYICTEGSVNIAFEKGSPVTIQKGETVLLPAIMHYIGLEPVTKSTLLEVFIK